jgi:hypothetical protein
MQVHGLLNHFQIAPFYERHENKGRTLVQD